MRKLLLASVIALLSVSAMAATCADMSNRELLDSLTATNKTVLDVVTITPITTTTDDNPKCYAHLVTQAGELQYNFTVTEIVALATSVPRPVIVMASSSDPTLRM